MIVQDRSPTAPLPAWAEGTTKRAALDFAPPAERVVVFDSDGPLWCE